MTKLRIQCYICGQYIWDTDPNNDKLVTIFIADYNVHMRKYHYSLYSDNDDDDLIRISDF